MLMKMLLFLCMVSHADAGGYFFVIIVCQRTQSQADIKLKLEALFSSLSVFC